MRRSLLNQTNRRRTQEDFWPRLIETEKEYCSENIIFISKLKTTITDRRLRYKLMKEKKLEMKKTIEIIKQNTCEKKNSKNTIPGALRSRRENQIKEEPVQRKDKFNTRPRRIVNNNRTCRFCKAVSLNPTHKCPAFD